MLYPDVVLISELATRGALPAQLVERSGKIRKAAGFDQLPPRLRVANPDSVGHDFPEVLSVP
eukprot:5931341-Pyramimonas_sp.AAC.1